MDDFYSDWCDEVGYTKDDVEDLFGGFGKEKGEFLMFDNGSIVRFSF